MEEVFERQPPHVQGFFLETSVLERLSAPLCDAVTGRDDAERHLVALEHANLFLLPLDDTWEWYRYHHLFAELLRHRLRTTRPSDIATLHSRASRWLAANGLPADAVGHALEAGDFGAAARLILDLAGDLLRRGEVTTLLGWFGRLPKERILASDDLGYAYAWPLLFADQLEPAELFLDRAEMLARERPSLLGEIASAQAFLARAREDVPRTIEYSRRDLSLIPESDVVVS